MSSLCHMDDLLALGLQDDEYAIVGSAALVLHGFLDSNADIDVIVNEDTFSRIKSKLHIKTGIAGESLDWLSNETGTIDFGLGGGGSDLFTWDEVVKYRTCINGLMTLNREGILLFYKRLSEKYGKVKHIQTYNRLKESV